MPFHSLQSKLKSAVGFGIQAFRLLCVFLLYTYTYNDPDQADWISDGWDYIRAEIRTSPDFDTSLLCTHPSLEKVKT